MVSRCNNNPTDLVRSERPGFVAFSPLTKLSFSADLVESILFAFSVVVLTCFSMMTTLMV